VCGWPTFISCFVCQLLEQPQLPCTALILSILPTYGELNDDDDDDDDDDEQVIHS